MDSLLSSGLAYAGHMTVTPDPQGLSAVRHKIRSVALDLDFCEDDAEDILIAAGEAISNAYSHGIPDLDDRFIRVGWCFDEGVLTLIVKDNGNGFGQNSSQFRSMLKAKGIGCGIMLMQESMDEVDFQFDCGMKVVMKKRKNMMHQLGLNTSTLLA